MSSPRSKQRQSASPLFFEFQFCPVLFLRPSHCRSSCWMLWPLFAPLAVVVSVWLAETACSTWFFVVCHCVLPYLAATRPLRHVATTTRVSRSRRGGQKWRERGPGGLRRWRRIDPAVARAHSRSSWMSLLLLLCVASVPLDTSMCSLTKRPMHTDCTHTNSATQRSTRHDGAARQTAHLTRA